MGYKIGIVGLGLMGGSMAFALRGFKDAFIAGTDANPEVCEEAKRQGAVDEAGTDAACAIEDADLVILCVYARHIPGILEKNRNLLRSGAVVTDICGVKSGLYKKIEGTMPDETDYVGIHPMAGKERDGFENADPAIFKDTGLIICPLSSTKPRSVELMRELAEYIGAKRVCVSQVEKHDEIIAYTSDLMHIAAAGLCMDYHPEMTSVFTAGAFRDSTRVADINAEAWTDLLTDNSKNTLCSLDRYISRLQDIRRCLAEGEDRELYELLDLAGKNKRGMLRK